MLCRDFRIYNSKGGPDLGRGKRVELAVHLDQHRALWSQRRRNFPTSLCCEIGCPGANSSNHPRVEGLLSSQPRQGCGGCGMEQLLPAQIRPWGSHFPFPRPPRQVPSPKLWPHGLERSPADPVPSPPPTTLGAALPEETEGAGKSAPHQSLFPGPRDGRWCL